MPVTLALNDVFQVRAWSVFGSQAACSVWNYKVTGPPIPTATDQSACTEFDNAIHLFYKNLIPPEVQYRGIQLQIVSGPPLLPVVVQSTLNAGAGLASVGGNARQVTGIISWYSNFAGPGNRGRTFFPFPPRDEDGNDATPSNVYMLNIQAMRDRLYELGNVVPVTGVQFNMIIYRRNLPIANSPFVTNGICRDMWATQKRRGSFGKPNSSPI